jgi:hypothetical protein
VDNHNGFLADVSNGCDKVIAVVLRVEVVSIAGIVFNGYVASDGVVAAS